MASLRRVSFLTGAMVVLLVRGFTLWVFYLPAVLIWLLALPVWPFARLLGLRLPAAPLYYVRWSGVLHDALLTRVLPVRSSPWPWQVDLREAMPRPFLEAD